MNHTALVNLCQRCGDPRADPATLRFGEPTSHRQHIGKAAVAGDSLYNCRVAGVGSLNRWACRRRDHTGTLYQPQNSAFMGSTTYRRHFSVIRCH